jgi:cytidylate kinase
MSGRVIAIDGPAASGKSTVARSVASAVGFLFVSSGHFYRALAWGTVVKGIPDEKLNAWVTERPLTVEDKENTISLLLDGKDATPHLSDPEVAAKVSQIATFPCMRDFVNSRLHALAEQRDLVMEGRDIGSVVFPATPWKFYLDASPEERARRRAREGDEDPIAERDRLDSTRVTAPLVIPEGSIVIDTTHLSLEQVVDAVIARLGNIEPLNP